MSPRFNLFRTVVVTPLPTKNHPVIYRAKYKAYVSYGRTPEEAVQRVSKRYYNSRFSVRNILNGIGIFLLPPY